MRLNSFASAPEANAASDSVVASQRMAELPQADQHRLAAEQARDSCSAPGAASRTRGIRRRRSGRCTMSDENRRPADEAAVGEVLMAVGASFRALDTGGLDQVYAQDAD